MNATSTRRAAREPEWFATWFDSPHYHKLYAHRDEQEAAGFIDRLKIITNWTKKLSANLVVNRQLRLQPHFTFE